MRSLSLDLTFIAAAAGLAATPGTGSVYVVARTLRGGWREGLASVAGTTSGAGVHVVAAALGGAALIGGDPVRARIVAIVGALYLGAVAIRGLWSDAATAAPEIASRRRAFRDGFLVAALNPTTALFLLAFLPQFVDPSRPALRQLLALGGITVALNAGAHLLWVGIGATAGGTSAGRPHAAKMLRHAGNVLLLVIAIAAVLRAFAPARVR
jgi:threonine/homoserine/homoserine lactone efflux protein